MQTPQQKTNEMEKSLKAISIRLVREFFQDKH